MLRDRMAGWMRLQQRALRAVPIAAIPHGCRFRQTPQLSGPFRPGSPWAKLLSAAQGRLQAHERWL